MGCCSAYRYEGRPAEELNHIIDDTCGYNNFVFRAVKAADDIKHGSKHHADSDGVGYIRQEEYGLQKFLQGFDRIEGNGNQKCKDCRDRHGEHAKEHRVFQALQEALVLNNLDKVSDTEGEYGTIGGFQTLIVLKKRHTYSIEDRPDREHQQQNDRRR